MQLEFHQLERRWEHLRVRHPQRQRRLLASLAELGSDVWSTGADGGSDPKTGAMIFNQQSTFNDGERRVFLDTPICSGVALHIVVGR